MFRTRSVTLGAALLLLPWLTGCVTVAEFRKLEYEVNKMRRSGGGASGGARVADLAVEIDALRDAVAQLEGRLEVTEHQSRMALEEARAARLDASRPGGAPAAGANSAGDTGPMMAPGEAQGAPQSASVELSAYREAYNTWRTDDHGACIDRFRDFLQTYPSSDYADDAAYWMADCYFKQGDYQTAILRFDDVAGRYPTSGKAPEALYRQGEALLRLGPRYGKAARKAFERVINEYPNSERAEQARRQLELLGPA
jgi:tol-pal system protein YbgF